MQNFVSLCLYHLSSALKENSSEVVQPFLMGCGTKEPKITQLCLAAIQRLMSHEVVSEVRTDKHVKVFKESLMWSFIPVIHRLLDVSQ